MPLEITLGPQRLITGEGVRAPHVHRLHCGDLLLTFHVDRDMHFPRRAALRSRDGGETWFADAPRCCKEFALGERQGGVVLALDRDTFEQREGCCLGLYYRSQDGGRTFEGPHESRVLIDRVESRGYPLSPRGYPDPEHLQAKFFGPVPEFYLPTIRRASVRRGLHFWRYLHHENGRWLAGMFGRYFGDNCNRCILVESRDDGRTWTEVSTIAYEYNRTIDGCSEPALRRVADGSLLCVMRRSGGQPMAQCRSQDDGRTWSQPELLVAHGVDPDLCLMSHGVLAMTFGRPGCFMQFSADGCGYAWGYRTCLGSFQGSAMMGLVETSPGRLLVVYDRRPDDSLGDDALAQGGIVCRSVEVRRTG